MSTIGTAGRAGAPDDVSGAVTGALLRYVRGRAGDFGVALTLAGAGEDRAPEVLEDPRGWSTHDEVVALLGAAGEVTGDSAACRRVGEEMLRRHDGTDAADALRSLASPVELLRTVTAAAARFTKICSLEALEVGETHAVVRAVTRTGHLRHPYLCELTKGLLSEVPATFGLAPAVLTETECQARGGRCCLYCLTWEEATPPPGHPAAASAPEPEAAAEPEPCVTAAREQLRQVTVHLEEIASIASDLASGADPGLLLATIARRAAGAVGASRHLLVLEGASGEPVLADRQGLDDDEVRALLPDLCPPGADDAGGTRLVADVTSWRRHHGRLATLHVPGRQFAAGDRELLTLYANCAAVALDLAELADDRSRSQAVNRALLDFSQALAGVRSTEGVSQALADAVPAVAGCERSWVLIWDPFQQKLILQAWCRSHAGPRPDAAGAAVTDEPPFAVSDGDATIVPVLSASRDVVVMDAETEDPCLRSLLERSGAACSVLAPLFSDEEFIGAVAAEFLDCPTGDPRADPGLCGSLRAVADQAVTALENAWLIEQMGPLAWHDALTGLPNRRLLEDRARKELERAGPAGQTTTVFFVDLDRFKRVNDTLGHAGGDELICQVARRMREVVRRRDTVARLGGDEFAVLLPALADMAAVRELADCMLESLRRPYVVDGREVRTSASIGIAVCPDHGDAYDDLLSHADEAMYRSKGRGRDTFTVFAAEGDAPDATGPDAAGPDAAGPDAAATIPLPGGTGR